MTEPHRSETSSTLAKNETKTTTKTTDLVVMPGSPYDLKADRYKDKPTFSKDRRFTTVEDAGKPPKLPTLKQSESPRSIQRSVSSLSQGGAMLEKISLSQMKANFARELQQMIANEIKNDQREKA